MALRWAIACRLALAPGGWVDLCCDVRSVTVRPILASAVLARVLRRLAGDYLTVYGHVLAALPEPRRLECKRLAPDLLLNKLYWVDLGNIIARNWQQFELSLI